MSKRVAVRERIEEELEADRLHGLAITQRDGNTVYCVVSQSTTWDRVDETIDHDVPVLDIRTVVVDFETDAVRVSDNGLWVPREAAVAESLTKILARSTTDLSGGTDDDIGPALRSSVDGLDPEMLLDREVEVEDAVDGQHVDKMDNHGGIDPAREWGYGAGPPPEVNDIVDRLTEAGLDPDEHLTRLVWGKKEPMDRTPRPVDELTGNYGIELLPRESGLVAIDVDYPEHFPDSELPETLEVSSPHGDDSQRHIILRCDEKDQLAEQLGAWAVQRAEWGDLWIGDRYVVGPGSQLSEFGCDEGDHTRGERGGCQACEDPDGGYYEVLTDAPIAKIDPEAILDLLNDSDGYETRDRAPEAPAVEDGVEIDTDSENDETVECDSCGATYPKAEVDQYLKEVTIGGETRHICRGGCN